MDVKNFIRKNVGTTLQSRGYSKQVSDRAIDKAMENWGKLGNTKNPYRDICNHAGMLAAGATGKKWVNVK